MPKGARRHVRVIFLVSRLLSFIGGLLVFASVFPFISQEILFYATRLKDQVFILRDFRHPTNVATVPDSPFARLLSTRPIALVPVDTNFGLVIERLGINVPVVKDVSVTDKQAYMAALNRGVAHASLSAYPSRSPGNVYLFAHASLGFWHLGKYATVFNLLHHLRVGDTIHVFFEGHDYVYKVLNIEKFPGFDVYPLERRVMESILTLQTCDPPGTTLNRLVVTSKLVDVN